MKHLRYFENNDNLEFKVGNYVFFYDDIEFSYDYGKIIDEEIINNDMYYNIKLGKDKYVTIAGEHVERLLTDEEIERFKMSDELNNFNL